MIWLETPSNPLLKLIDIKKIKKEITNETYKKFVIIHLHHLIINNH